MSGSRSDAWRRVEWSRTRRCRVCLEWAYTRLMVGEVCPDCRRRWMAGWGWAFSRVARGSEPGASSGLEGANAHTQPR